MSEPGNAANELRMLADIIDEVERELGTTYDFRELKLVVRGTDEVFIFSGLTGSPDDLSEPEPEDPMGTKAE